MIKLITLSIFLFGLSISFGQNKNDTNKSNENPSSFGFQENKGQFEDLDHAPAPYILFKLESKGLNVWVTNTGLTYHFFSIENKIISMDSIVESRNDRVKIMHSRRIDMILKNATIKAENIIAENCISEGYDNYYLGHCPNGIFDVKIFQKIIIKEIYTGIDWVLYTTGNGSFKHDFIIHPNADPSEIRMIYEGDGSLNEGRTKLEISTKLGDLTERNLFCYQNSETIDANYEFKQNNFLTHLGAGNFSKQKNQLVDENTFSYEVTINLDNYDRSQKLIIDPELVWGTYYVGNSFEGTMSVAIDQDGNFLSTGYTNSSGFPVLDAGTYFRDSPLVPEAFILKFDNNGVRLWATNYGGSGFDLARAINVDVNNDILIVGETTSEDIPTIGMSGGFLQFMNAGSRDIFIAKFDNSGTLLYATYYGGTGFEIADGLTTDLDGSVFITGSSNSSDFPVYDNGTYYDNTYAGGNDIFILKFSNIFERQWSTYYGGSSLDAGSEIETDLEGNIYVTGETTSTDFQTEDIGGFFHPSLLGSSDGFILKFDNEGNRLWATYLGGSDTDYGISIISDQENNVFVSGVTVSLDFPVLDAGTYFQEFHGGGVKDAFIMKFDRDGHSLWSTYYGGSGTDGSNNPYGDNPSQLAVDECDNIYFVFDSYHGTGAEDVPVYDPGSCSFYEVFTGGIHLFLVRFQNDGTRDLATYVSRSFRGSIALDQDNNMFFGSEGRYRPEEFVYLVDPGGGVYHEIGNGGEDLTFYKLVDELQTELVRTEDTLCGCSGEATVTLCGLPPYSYKWSTGLEIIDTNVNSMSIDNLCVGEYWVEVKAGCYDIDTLYFTLENSFLDLNLGNDTTLCNDISFHLDAENEGVDYLWQDGSIEQTFIAYASGTYWVTVDNGEGCTLTDTIVLSFGEIEVELGNDTSYCESGSLLILDAGFSESTYTWQDESSEQTYDVFTTGTYWVVVDSAGCSGSDTVMVTIHPKFIVDIGGDGIICDYDSIVLDAGNPGLNYTWSSGETSQTITVNESGTYWVGVSNEYCEYTDTVHLSFVDCTGIIELYNGFVTIYPNPFKEYTTIHFGEELIDNHTIILNDMNGKEIIRIPNLRGTHFILKNERLTKGVYILSLIKESSQKEMFTEIIIVN